MTAAIWEATIRLPNGNQQRVRVQADTQWNARQMLELQYGLNCILFGPHRISG
jgi:hypothetical protein